MPLQGNIGTLLSQDEQWHLGRLMPVDQCQDRARTEHYMTYGLEGKWCSQITQKLEVDLLSMGYLATTPQKMGIIFFLATANEIKQGTGNISKNSAWYLSTGL